MQLIEVNSPELNKAFLEQPISLYKNDKNWIRPLDSDIEKVFDKAKNKQYRDGDAIRWLLKDENGKYIGRIAAFYNTKTPKSNGLTTGGMGFFECINNQEAANTLLDAARKWLLDKGLEAMDGPINFGGREAWWGCLYEGFYPPTYLMNYNPPYYNDLLEDYGFQVYFNQFVYNYAVSKPVPQKFYEKAERCKADPKYRFEHINKNKLEQYAEYLTAIYNEGWSKMGFAKPVTVKQTLNQLKQMKPIMDERLMWFGFYDNRPIAFFLMLPEINELMRHMNGKMHLWNKLRFAFMLKIGRIRNIMGILFGIVPDYQGQGIEGAIITAAAAVVQPQTNYQNLEMNWVGDFNPKMVNMVKGLETELYRTYRTYRFVFDRTKMFERAPVVG